MGNGEIKIIEEEIKPIITGLGYSLVEVKLGKSKNLNDITIVIYKKGGVSLNNCVEVTKHIKPQLDSLDDFENIALKVTSPGIDRKIKEKYEYEIFKGKGVKILLQQDSDWIGGVITAASYEKLILKCQDKLIEIDTDHIKKAKLDYAEEVRNK
jgi:ribosome maturation factor RimP